MTSADPGPLADWEALGRRVNSSSTRRKVEKKTTPLGLFYEEDPDESGLSVDRVTVADHSFIVGVADRETAKFNPGCNFYGWAVVVAEQVREAGYQVHESPKPDNPYHADIVLAVGKEARLQQATTLARLASQWKPR